MGDGKVIINLQEIRAQKILEEIRQDKIMLEMANKNEREYEEFLKKNNLEKNWDTWDMFAEKKWGY